MPVGQTWIFRTEHRRERPNCRNDGENQPAQTVNAIFIYASAATHCAHRRNAIGRQYFHRRGIYGDSDAMLTDERRAEGAKKRMRSMKRRRPMPATRPAEIVDVFMEKPSGASGHE